VGAKIFIQRSAAARNTASWDRFKEVANTSSIWKEPAAGVSTVTPNDEVAPDPSGSVADTVTVAIPEASAETTTALPDTATVATLAFDDAAV